MFVSEMLHEVASGSSDRAARSKYRFSNEMGRLTGIRNYNSNVRTLFDENYALAATQNLSTLRYMTKERG